MGNYCSWRKWVGKPQNPKSNRVILLRVSSSGFCIHSDWEPEMSQHSTRHHQPYPPNLHVVSLLHLFLTACVLLTHAWDPVCYLKYLLPSMGLNNSSPYLVLAQVLPTCFVLRFLNFLYMCVVSEEDVCVRVCSCPKRPEESLWFLRTAVKSRYNALVLET